MQLALVSAAYSDWQKRPMPRLLSADVEGQLASRHFCRGARWREFPKRADLAPEPEPEFFHRPPGELHVDGRLPFPRQRGPAASAGGERLGGGFCCDDDPL